MNYNNQLLNSYQNHQNYQRGSAAFANNNLLSQNNLFQNNMGYNSAQLEQMKRMQMAHAKKVQEMQKIKQIERLNELENQYDINKIKEAILTTKKIVKDKSISTEIEAKLNEKKATYEKDIEDYRKSRTNIAYKGIIKCDENKQIKNETDLIIHTVTKQDAEGVDEDFNKLKGNLEKHNNELKVIYSTNKEAEHKKKFEYNHKYVYRRMPHDATTHQDNRANHRKIYEEQQRKLEDGAKKRENIIEALINSDIFSKEELKNIN